VTPNALVRRLAGAVLALPLLLVLAAGPASAHAALDSSDPAQGSQLASAPAAVQLVFSEEVTLTDRSVQVTDPRGQRVDDGKAAHPADNGRAVRVGLRSGLERGSYTVSWRVASVDGHPVAGIFSFGIGVPAGAPPPQDNADPLVSAARSLVQLLSYVGAALLIGATVFLFGLWPAGRDSARLSRLTTGAVAVAAIGSIGALLVQGPYVAGRGLTGVFDPSLLLETVSSSYGRPLLLRVLAIALAVPVLGIWPRIPPGEESAPSGVAGIGNAVLLAASFSLTGHAAESSPRFLAEIADGLHLTAAGIWLGGLAVLILVFLPDTDPEREADVDTRVRVLARWSRTAMAAVGVLLVTGSYQAWRETGSVDAVTQTGYGRLLITKVSVVLGLLLLAAFARSRIGSVREGVGTLRRLVESEVVLGLAVLTVTTFLVATPPARTTYSPPLSLTVRGVNAEGQAILVTVDVAPTRVGPQTVRLHTYTTTGDVQPFGSITGTLSRSDAADAAPVRVAFAPTAAGQAVASDVVVPSAGQWTLTVQVLTDATTDYAAEAKYAVR